MSSSVEILDDDAAGEVRETGSNVKVIDVSSKKIEANRRNAQ